MHVVFAVIHFDLKKKGKSSIAPLQPPTLATFRSWGIQQELVVLICLCKGKRNWLNGTKF